jgi:hypothetical protein
MYFNKIWMILGLGVWLSDRVLAWHAQGPGFDPSTAEQTKSLDHNTQSQLGMEDV